MRWNMLEPYWDFVALEFPTIGVHGSALIFELREALNATVRSTIFHQASDTNLHAESWKLQKRAVKGIWDWSKWRTIFCNKWVCLSVKTMQFAPSSHTSQTPAEWWSAKPWIGALRVSPAYELRIASVLCQQKTHIFPFRYFTLYTCIYMHVASKLDERHSAVVQIISNECFFMAFSFHFNWAWGPSNRASKPCAISCRQAHTCSKFEAPNTQGSDPNRSSCSSSQGFLTSALMPTSGFCSSSKEKTHRLALQSCKRDHHGKFGSCLWLPATFLLDFVLTTCWPSPLCVSFRIVEAAGLWWGFLRLLFDAMLSWSLFWHLDAIWINMRSGACASFIFNQKPEGGLADWECCGARAEWIRKASTSLMQTYGSHGRSSEEQKAKDSNSDMFRQIVSKCIEYNVCS